MADKLGSKSKYTSAADDEFEHVGESTPMSSEERYLKADFTAMDSDKDGMLSTAEFLKLIQFLGYGERAEANSFLKRVNKDENAFITIDEYYTAINNNPEAVSRTNRMRDLFKMFDKNLDGSAFKTDIYKGFEDMGFELDKDMKSEIDKMDLNKDGKVKYEDFLAAQLRQKGVL